MFRTILSYLLTMSFGFGFNLYSNPKPWAIDNSSVLKRKIFVDYDFASRTLKNNLPSGDSLAATSNITVQLAMNSIMNDYNNIRGAYVVLVDTSDPDYTTANATDHVIKIRNQATDGLNGGQTKYEYTNGKFSGCSIKLSDRVYDNAKSFIATTTHEIGHCMGLDHPQDTVYAIMSYFRNSDIYRLETDDKMGIIFLYPEDPAAAAESSTLGLSCARRN